MLLSLEAQGKTEAVDSGLSRQGEDQATPLPQAIALVVEALGRPLEAEATEAGGY